MWNLLGLDSSKIMLQKYQNKKKDYSLKRERQKQYKQLETKVTSFSVRIWYDYNFRKWWRLNKNKQPGIIKLGNMSQSTSLKPSFHLPAKNKKIIDMRKSKNLYDYTKKNVCIFWCK